MEEVLASHARCRRMRGGRCEGRDLKGQTPIGLVVLKAGVNRPEAEICRRAGGVGARADRAGGGVQGCPRGASAAEDTVGQDPARPSIRRIADGETAPVPPTIEDPAALDEVRRVLSNAAILRG